MHREANRVKAIFDRAVEINSAAERDDFVLRECADDAELRAKVQVLLGAYDQAGSFLESPPVGVQIVTVDQPSCVPPGTLVGPYKLIQPIGEGGMGTVFMAEQTQPVRRTVALKLIKAGMDSRQILARFGAERQALALMDHPNIAKVFDAGATEQGRPYFVMELVKGVPITKFCDERRLTLRERLELAIPVCQAVQHAHQKGIIHRDLKPSNVLIALYDGKPVPKIIDFGVAKATGPRLTDQTLYTEFGAVVGTLEYMSPEQAELNQLDIDTRSDIYSLGVLLYELLTGSTPLEHKRIKQAVFLELLRVIREEEAPRPSLRLSTTEELPSIAACRHVEPQKLSGLVRGELDWIVMKALEKDRNRRYETANGLAADLRRYLEDEPVQACPPSGWYRFGKFARRNKAALTTAVLVSLALVAALGGLAVSNALIRREMTKTEEQRAQAVNQRAQADHQRAQADEKAEALRRHDYISRVNLAYRECLAGNVAQAEELLVGCPVDLRGWEWPYVSRQCHLDLQSFHEAGPGVNAVAFSYDGRYLASGSGELLGGESGDLVVRDVATGREVFAHRGLSGIIRAVAFSPDGRWLAAGHATFLGSYYNPVRLKSNVRPRDAEPAGTLTLWDATTGQQRFQKTNPGRFGLFSLAFSPDSRRIIAGYADSDSLDWPSPGHAKLWDATTGELLIDRIPGPEIGVYSVAFSPNGKHVALAGIGRVDVWDLGSRRLIRALQGHTNAVYAVAFSPDGRYLASGGRDQTIRLWDCVTGALVRTYAGHEGAVLSLAFCPDGQRFVSASGNSLNLWSVASGRELATFHGHQHSVQCVAVSPDASRIASGSADQTVKLWFVTPNLQLSIQGLSKDHVRGVAFSPDGRSVASVSADGVLELWDPITGEQRLSFQRESSFGAVAFSPDGRRLATSGLYARVRIWDANTGANILTLMGRKEQPGNVAWPSLAFSPDGHRLALADNEPSVKVFDATTGQRVHTLEGHSAAANVVAFSPDRRTLASAGDDKTVKIWDAATGQELLTLKGHAGPVYGLAFSPDGRKLASGGGNGHQFGEVRVWDSSTGRELYRLEGHTDLVWGVAFSPDGRRLATAGEDLTIKLWDMATAQEVFTLRGHTAPVRCLAFSPDGRRIVSGSNDCTVKVWDLDASRAEVLSRREAVAQAATGKSLLETGRWDQAAAALTKALELKLDNPQIRLARGQAYARLRQFSKADADFARAYTLTAANAPAQLAQLHMSIGESYLSVDRWDQASVALTRALELKMDNPRLRVARGRAFARTGQSQKAEADFARALELTTAGAESSIINLWELGHQQRILAFALEAEPGQLAKAESELRKAVKTFDQLTAEQPGTIGYLDYLADTHRRLARVLKSSGQRDAAVAEYREAIRLHEERLLKVPDPTLGADERAAAYLEYAVLLSELGRSAEARTFYQKALAAQPDTTGSYNNRAWLLATCTDETIRDPGRAVELARIAVDRRPEQGSSWNTLGVAHYRAGNWKAAIEALTQSMELRNGGDSFDWFVQAMAHWQLGDKPQARSWFDRAVPWMEKNQPTSEELVRFRAEAAVLLGVKAKKK
jgi:WD40 repeat protein/serine/threonine protein kinase/tetratricopeptide (TPR) repeat protein